MNNLIAYMPVLNRQYLNWLERNQPFRLFLISPKMASSSIPRLERNLISLSAREVYDLLVYVQPVHYPQSSLGYIFVPQAIDFSADRNKKWIMPDEDISHVVAEEYLYPAGCQVEFEPIWARWDMTAVKRQEPVIPDVEVSLKKTDLLAMIATQKFAQNSPDWWRQVGAMAFKDGKMIACAFNRHYPTEYETAIFGDLRINFDAGDPAGTDIYLSLHAEKGIVTSCAREGISLRGASVHVTTFPCGDCARMLADCQIKELFFAEGYSSLKGFETLKTAGVRIVKVNT